MRRCLFLKIKKSARRGSNPRPPPWQGGAPPLSHSRICKALNLCVTCKKYNTSLLYICQYIFSKIYNYICIKVTVQPGKKMWRNLRNNLIMIVLITIVFRINDDLYEIFSAWLSTFWVLFASQSLYLMKHHHENRIDFHSQNDESSKIVDLKKNALFW